MEEPWKGSSTLSFILPLCHSGYSFGLPDTISRGETCSYNTGFNTQFPVLTVKETTSLFQDKLVKKNPVTSGNR